MAAVSRPACAEVNLAVQEFTGISYNIGEHNKNMTAARIARNWKGTLTVATPVFARTKPI